MYAYLIVGIVITVYTYGPVLTKLHVMNCVIQNWSSKIDTTTPEKGSRCCHTFLTAF